MRRSPPAALHLSDISPRPGVPLDRIATRIRHERLATPLERYIGLTQALEMTSSKELGLRRQEIQPTGRPTATGPVRRGTWSRAAVCADEDPSSNRTNPDAPAWPTLSATVERLWVRSFGASAGVAAACRSRRQMLALASDPEDASGRIEPAWGEGPPSPNSGSLCA